jgi:hypothetical protein
MIRMRMGRMSAISTIDWPRSIFVVACIITVPGN